MPFWNIQKIHVKMFWESVYQIIQCRRVIEPLTKLDSLSRCQSSENVLFQYIFCLPIDPPCPSWFGEEQVTVGQLLKLFSSHSHIKLTALQLIPISHLVSLIGVETRAHKESQKPHDFHHVFAPVNQNEMDSLLNAHPQSSCGHLFTNTNNHIHVFIENMWACVSRTTSENSVSFICKCMQQGARKSNEIICYDGRTCGLSLKPLSCAVLDLFR